MLCAGLSGSHGVPRELSRHAFAGQCIQKAEHELKARLGGHVRSANPGHPMRACTMLVSAPLNQLQWIGPLLVSKFHLEASGKSRAAFSDGTRADNQTRGSREERAGGRAAGMTAALTCESSLRCPTSCSSENVPSARSRSPATGSGRKWAGLGGSKGGCPSEGCLLLSWLHRSLPTSGSRRLRSYISRYCSIEVTAAPFCTRSGGG